MHGFGPMLQVLTCNVEHRGDRFAEVRTCKLLGATLASALELEAHHVYAIGALFKVPFWGP